MTEKNFFVEGVRAEIRNMPARSAWRKGVKEYAEMLLDNVAEYGDTLPTAAELRNVALNGANDWNQFSWGGGALVYNRDIAERLCNPTELKRTHYGDRTPNSGETWADVQARALCQAAQLLQRCWSAVPFALCEKYEELACRAANTGELEELSGFFFAELSSASNEWATNFADLLTYSSLPVAINTVVNLMDDDLREELNGEIAPCSFAEFVGTYADAHRKKFGEIWVFDEANPCF